MIEIKPDPKHPRGGFAEITISGATADDDPVSVAVFNSYQQKWLGADGWQPNRASIPARTAEQGGDTLRLVVGPEVVNHIEEDTPVRIEVGGGSWDTYWPDDINAGPDEAVIGGIGGTGTAPEVKAPTVMVAQPQTDDAESGVDVGDDGDAKSPDSNLEGKGSAAPSDTFEEESEGKSSKTGLIIGGVVVAAVLGALAYLFLIPGTTPEEDPVEVTEPEPEAAPDPEPAPEQNACAMSQFAELSSQGFDAVAGKMRECGGSLSADDALGLVEKAALAGDAEALALFGSIYDSGVTDDVIEGRIGLTFPDKPSLAAEYYDRAVKAGSQEAADRLAAVCTRLRIKSDSLSKSAFEDYCQ